MRVAATITAIQQATPTVRTLSLAVADPAFTFLPGQWVDFYVNIGEREQVTGYSITSSPLQRGSIDLAVKREGRNPVTQYIHTAAAVGDRVEIEVGGDFAYRGDAGPSLVLIAGGIGINPIMSILRYVDEAAPEVAATVLYSVRTPCELLFGDEIRRMANRRENIRAFFTATRTTGKPWHGRTGRIDASMLQSIDLDPSASYYLCGPPSMVKTVRLLLTQIGVDRTRINYEAW
jgi:ferredoxin-NADP reductase